MGRRRNGCRSSRSYPGFPGSIRMALGVIKGLYALAKPTNEPSFLEPAAPRQEVLDRLQNSHGQEPHNESHATKRLDPSGDALEALERLGLREYHLDLLAENFQTMV